VGSVRRGLWMAAAYRPRFSDASTTYGDGPQVSDRVTADRTFAPPGHLPLGFRVIIIYYYVCYAMLAARHTVQYTHTYSHTRKYGVTVLDCGWVIRVRVKACSQHIN